MHAPSRPSFTQVAALASVVALGACDKPLERAAQVSLAALPGDVRVAREGLDRYLRGFLPTVGEDAPAFAPRLVAGDPTRVRFDLLGLAGRQTSHGALREYSPTFVAVTDRTGVVIARDLAEADDRMHGMPFAPLFAAVRTALAGTATTSVDEMPATTDQPSRVYLVAAAPVNGPDGTALGALVAGVSLGHLAHALDGAVRVHAGALPALWTGLAIRGRVVPSGSDRDVPPRWLVPAALVHAIPRDAAARAAGAATPVTWTFIENDAFAWAGSLTRLDALPGVNLVLYRAEANQR